MPGGAVVRNQTELAALEGVTCLSGALEILATSVTDLSPLSSLQTVGGGLRVHGNTELENLAGLSGLEHMLGSISIKNNAKLRSLHGLAGLHYLTAGIYIENNAALESLDGLNGLRSMPKGIASPYSLHIEANPALSDISALDNVVLYRGDPMSIADNTSLAQCQVDALASALGTTCDACTGNGSGICQ